MMREAGEDKSDRPTLFRFLGSDQVRKHAEAIRRGQAGLVCGLTKMCPRAIGNFPKRRTTAIARTSIVFNNKHPNQGWAVT